MEPKVGRMDKKQSKRISKRDIHNAENMLSSYGLQNLPYVKWR